MEAIFQDMKELYAARRLSQVDSFMENWLDPRCVVMGTALGELERTREELRELFDSDLRTWYDLDIDAEHVQRRELGEYSYLRCPAVSSYTIHENAQRYESYERWCGELAKDPVASPAARGAQIAFILDTLLSSRRYKRRKNSLPLTIHALMRRGKAVFLNFSFDKTLNSADHYLGDSTDTAESYAEERSQYSCEGYPHVALPGVAEYVRSLGYEDPILESSDGKIFYGVALQPRRETLNEAMEALLTEPRSGDAYQALFDLRLQIAFLQKVYALEAHPRAVVRFFGVAENGATPLFVPVFPLCVYLERNA